LCEKQTRVTDALFVSCAIRHEGLYAFTKQLRCRTILILSK